MDGSSAGELIPELARHGLQQLIELEVAAVLDADRHERSEERLGYRNGEGVRPDTRREGPGRSFRERFYLIPTTHPTTQTPPNKRHISSVHSGIGGGGEKRLRIIRPQDASPTLRTPPTLDLLQCHPGRAPPSQVLALGNQTIPPRKVE